MLFVSAHTFKKTKNKSENQQAWKRLHTNRRLHLARQASNFDMAVRLYNGSNSQVRLTLTLLR